MPRRSGTTKLGTLIWPCLVLATVGTGCLPRSFAARMILEPHRRAVQETIEPPHVEVAFPGDGVELRGWLFPARPPVKGTVIFLHGRNQNRDAGIVVARRLVPLGYDVLAYDSRAHGASEGKYSTFGFYEKHDVSRAIDFLGADRVVLAGVSLGSAVAIQAAAEDPRVVGVVAVSSFSSMEEIVRERIPRVVGDGQVQGALREVEQRSGMRVKDADSVAAARRVSVPVLLLHGDRDAFTPLVHTQQIYAALQGEREIVQVPGARHADVLRFDAAWEAILAWLPSIPEGAPRWAAQVERPDADVHVGAHPRGDLDGLGKEALAPRLDALEAERVVPGAALGAIGGGGAKGLRVQLAQ
jgi:pimeloyl-ACP methyl ester carboxylesterase